MTTTIAESRTPTLAELATEINDLHRRAESAMRSGLEHALAAGQLLTEAKAQCQHGDWGQWLADNFEGSERTAQAYMRVARRWPELESKAQRVADLTFGRALRAVASNAQKVAALPEGRRGAVLDAWEEHDCANAHQAVCRTASDGEAQERPGCERRCRVPVEHEGEYCPDYQAKNDAEVKAAEEAIARGEDPFRGICPQVTNLARANRGLPPVCPNCGGFEFDEDGDCAKCREPDVAPAPADAEVVEADAQPQHEPTVDMLLRLRGVVDALYDAHPEHREKIPMILRELAGAIEERLACPEDDDEDEGK